MTGELPGSVSFPSAGSGGIPNYNPTRRTALVLVGEGTSAAYLAGALGALESAGVRVDLVLGKGAGAVVAAYGAIQSAGSCLARTACSPLSVGRVVGGFGRPIARRCIA